MPRVSILWDTINFLRRRKVFIYFPKENRAWWICPRWRYIYVPTWTIKLWYINVVFAIFDKHCMGGGAGFDHKPLPIVKCPYCNQPLGVWACNAEICLFWAYCPSGGHLFQGPQRRSAKSALLAVQKRRVR